MAGVTKTTNINTHVREIDFVTRFGNNLQALMNILQISRLIKKESGTTLTTTVADIVLESGNVEEGATIPISVANVHDVPYADITIEKYGKAVSIEAVSKYGAEKAVQMTDDALLMKLQKNITNKFYTFLRTGSLTHLTTSFQMALAMANGYVRDMWSAMDKDITDIVGFVNDLDAFEYMGNASVTVQQAFGMQYLVDFMGYPLVFLMDSTRIPRGNVLATPVENIVAYYVDPSDSDFARLGLEYTVAGETPFVGFHAQGNYSNATGETYALMGIELFAEYVNGIANVKFSASGSLGAVTVASAAGTATGDSKITVTYTKGVGEKLYYIDAASAKTPTYKDVVDLTGWTAIETGDTNISDLTSGNTITVIAVNGTGQAVASGNATIVVKA